MARLPRGEGYARAGRIGEIVKADDRRVLLPEPFSEPGPTLSVGVRYS
ncbi:MAG: hypothetical protein AVDCRST_MAG78-3757 [uncultured Rubrobacteraceae bacterium]|uniref:Uncharacterized protein n=1 Tax=uncultured Rubrobacteraceae bacterium TaxID=349277 RepID=A0A6J4QT66_9ACTN|nr:MAG: hypothetical protein AVDCRST_MAG78-3757 [uncultured Rubrobacteraceae bacterium]